MDKNKPQEMEQEIARIEAKNRETSSSFFANALLGLTSAFASLPHFLRLGGGKDERGKIIRGSNTGRPYHKEIYVSHNDPCPCGSGKKFKYCCLKQ